MDNIGLYVLVASAVALAGWLAWMLLRGIVFRFCLARSFPLYIRGVLVHEEPKDKVVPWLLLGTAHAHDGYWGFFLATPFFWLAIGHAQSRWFVEDEKETT